MNDLVPRQGGGDGQPHQAAEDRQHGLALVTNTAWDVAKMPVFRWVLKKVIYLADQIHPPSKH